MSTAKILTVDDEPAICFAIRQFFERSHYEVLEATDGRSALEALRRSCAEVVLLDYSLPDGDSLNLIQQMRRLEPDAAIIVLTGHGSIELAVQAMKEGAEHFLTKPVQLPVLRLVVERALENRRNRHKVQASESRSREIEPFLGCSPAIRRLARMAQRAAETDLPVLIQGETGTGKGVLAAWLHRNGPRAASAFVDINCAGLSRELLESELFGYEKGAFTGAVGSKIGLLEVAHRGTVFLDEIGDAELPVQAKLLKALEEKKFRRLGDVRDRQTDARMITATHHELRRAVAEQKFRNDLYFRISVVVLETPPLCQRVADIPAIVSSLLEGISRELGRREVTVSAKATEVLQRYHWPGNIRELRNVLERALLISEGHILEPWDLMLDEDASQAISPVTSNETVVEVERQHILKVLGEESGHIPTAAKRLGIPRSSLYKRIKRLGIVPSRAAQQTQECVSYRH